MAVHSTETDRIEQAAARTAWWWRTLASPRDGRFIEVIGHYNPLTEPPTVEIDRAKAAAWISKGAQPSNTVKKLLASGEKPVSLAVGGRRAPLVPIGEVMRAYGLRGELRVVPQTDRPERFRRSASASCGSRDATIATRAAHAGRAATGRHGAAVAGGMRLPRGGSPRWPAGCWRCPGRKRCRPPRRHFYPWQLDRRRVTTRGRARRR